MYITQNYSIVHFKTVKMVDFMLCDFFSIKQKRNIVASQLTQSISQSPHKYLVKAKNPTLPPTQQLLHFSLTHSVPAINVLPVVAPAPPESFWYQDLCTWCFLRTPLLPGSLWFAPHCLQVSAQISPPLWSSPWPHTHPHGISYSPYCTSFFFLALIIIWHIIHLLIVFIMCLPTLECKLLEGRHFVSFTDVSAVPRTVPNTC